MKVLITQAHFAPFNNSSEYEIIHKKKIALQKYVA